MRKNHFSVANAAIDPVSVAAQRFAVKLRGTRLKVVLSDSLPRLQELSTSPCFTGALQSPVTLGQHGEMSLCVHTARIYQFAQWGDPSVSVLDCRYHTWREAPSFPVKLLTRHATVVDKKIYVAGRYQHGNSLSNLSYVLDTETQIWDPLPPVPCTADNNDVFGTACIDGKFHAVASSGLDAAYNSKQVKWDRLRSEMGKYVYGNSYCVIGNVLCSACRGNFRWYDYEAHVWRDLNGLVGLPELSHEHEIRLADYGGNMVVFWKQYLHSMTKIWCAEVSLERRRQSCEIWGKVEWLDHVLTLPVKADLIKVLALTV
ncbi:unnamed protein product [Microthlaspi erraticum]|uniref:FKB95-like N-terminal Kelch domain-containing protein n=1 Tax=Microthlaspi erraticum TaxID=1685480 RepID=A0A6D2L5C3_9BRAS|nr:unnamed protein product [Microthlaspi erraticum]